MGARVMGRGVALQPARRRGTSLLQHARTGPGSRSRRWFDTLARSRGRAGRRYRFSGAHASSSPRRGVRRRKRAQGAFFGRAGGRHRRHRRSGRGCQREDGRLRPPPARRSPNRSDCGCARRMEGDGRGCRDRCGSCVDVEVRVEPSRRHRCGGPKHRSVLLPGGSGAARALLIAPTGVNLVYARREAASRLVACNTRSARDRRSATAADSCLCAVYIRPSCGVSLIPARWEQRGKARRRN